ncbi:tetratricopeptide repeat protein [Selenomonas ruminantium]|uniref:TPR repeat n=1 Tax=Selenomonas ruminantium TaxID=971 RepID=A0A1H3X4P4_SELRU|nr:tetratricopeptide repeat protein [Selenomonas ruminantium]SDZ94356.1 TPR repeat [Selenomonas ruminantium]
MAKKIKFTLEMKDGVQARTLEDLQENFDMEKVVGYFTDGRLQTWLEERYYEDEAEAVSKMSKDATDFHKKLCEALGVAVVEEELSAIDIEEVERRKQRLENLRQYTAEKNILDKVDFVAFNQEELGDLLSDGVSEIILCNGSFRIPLKQKNKKYIGVGRVEAVIKSEEKVDFSALGISFVNVKFDEKYDKLENQSGAQLYEMAKKEENIEKSIELLKMASDKGDATAMHELGMKYMNGDGVEEDYNKGIEFFEKSAQLGNADAMLDMGDAYFNGITFEKNTERAFEWYMKGADNGNAECMVIIAVRYVNGEWGEKNDKEAVRLLKKSLEEKNDFKSISMLYLGHIYGDENSDYYNPKEAFQWYKKSAKDDEDNCYWVGECYLKGIGVQADRYKAIDWYSKAADAGDGSSMNALGLIYGQIADERNSYSEIKEARKKEIQWYEKAIEKGNVAANYNLAYCYHHGIGVQKVIGKAGALYRKAAKDDYILAMVKLGDIFLFDNEPKVVAGKEARKWYEKAAELGNGEAMQGLGKMFEEGKGVSLNYRVAFEWYKKSVDAGYISAMVDIGLIYEDGKGVSKNYAEACHWYKMAADKGNACAMRLIGRLYFNGNGVTKDEGLAMQWWQRSADAGDKTAKKWIDEVKTAKSQGKSGGCFITTAVCDTLGKSDDCYELTMFRDFRDNWMAVQADGEALIQEYYVIAPKIVSAINQLPNAKEIYQNIWDKSLSGCLRYIEQGNMLACKEKYVEMVQKLRKKYIDT